MPDLVWGVKWRNCDIDNYSVYRGSCLSYLTTDKPRPVSLQLQPGQQSGEDFNLPPSTFHLPTGECLDGEHIDSSVCHGLYLLQAPRGAERREWRHQTCRWGDWGGWQLDLSLHVNDTLFEQNYSFQHHHKYYKLLKIISIFILWIIFLIPAGTHTTDGGTVPTTGTSRTIKWEDIEEATSHQLYLSVHFHFLK